jgi:hypothetical protein
VHAPLTLFIGSEQADYLMVSPSRRQLPEMTDFWDGNWLCATIRVRAGAFRGEYEAQLRTTEFASFRDQLRVLHDKLVGTATFDALEHWLRVDVEADGKGHFQARCEANDDPSFPSRLRFSLNFDQTELPPILRALDAICEAFPVRGLP